MTDDDHALSEICDIIRDAAGPGRGFAFFLNDGRAWRYASSADRADVIETLEEWLEHIMPEERAIPNTPLPPPTDSGSAMASLCREIGLVITATDTEVLLFLFDQNDERTPGDVAFFSNAPHAARQVVEHWLRREARRAKSRN